MDKALLLVDIQNDFLPTGALPVPRGDEIIPVINRLVAAFDGHVVASQDWHPADHLSFASQHPGRRPFETIALDGLQQTLWPDHCVQHTPGAEFAPGLDTSRIEHVVRKGTDRRIDSYSAFHDNGHRRSTGLADWLRERGVRRVVVTGLAADVCVFHTAMDALAEGFETVVVEDATRGVELSPGDTERAFATLRERGARILRADALLAGR